MVFEDDLPIFRPKLRRQPRAARVPTLGASLRRRGSKSRAAPPMTRRVVVKARVVKMTPAGRKAAVAHVKYILREGVGRDGTPGALYGREGPVRAEDVAPPIEGEPHPFRCRPRTGPSWISPATSAA